jgi:hypothetical protein
MAYQDRYMPPFAQPRSPEARKDGPVLPETVAGTQTDHAAGFIVRRTAEADISPDAPVLRLEVPEQPIEADQN